MTTNGINVCEDAEMADCDGEKVVTMMDVLKEQEDFEEDANAVLGASDDKNCTYPKGYIKRQAIYACMSCCVDAKDDPTKWAGVCLACSLTCHENHDLIELYTKRNFRCDCGNPKFTSHPCQFTPDKTDLNEGNMYNQNFSGLYCICHRPYPDPESTSEGDMIQCIICEDWLHSNHLEAVVPPNDQYSEMICKACMDKNEFLHDYSELAVNKENMDVDILNTSLEVNPAENCTENKNVLNPTIDDAVDEHIDNISNGNVNEESEIKIGEQNEAVPEVCNEQEPKQVSDDNSDSKIEDNNTEAVESGETIVKAQPDSIDTNSVACEQEQINTETESKNDGHIEETNNSVETIEKIGDNVNEKEAEPASVENAAASDKRSQEEVEEDLLLADPMEVEESSKELKQKSDVDTPTITPSTEDSLQKKDDLETMDTSETANDVQVENTADKGDLKDGSNSDNKPVVEQSEGITSSEQHEKIVTTEEPENETTVEQTEAVPDTQEIADIPNSKESKDEQSSVATNAENISPTKETENGVNAEQSETPESIEQSNNVSTTEPSENIAEESEQISTVSDDKSNIPNVPNIEDGTTPNLEGEDKTSCDTEEPENGTADVSNIENCDITNIEVENKTSDMDQPVNSTEPEPEVLKRKLSTDTETDDNVEVKKPKLDESKCVRPRGVKKVYRGATFWPSNLRHKLCTCSECIAMYKDLAVLFLIDPEDTVTAYETLGKDKTDGKPASQYEKGMAALSSLGRVQQINALTEYGKLRDKLLEFLKTFKDNKVIVKEEDIKAFFAGMKPVREPDGVYFCR